MIKMYDIKGMKCAGCSTGIESTLRAMEGIKSADVNLSMATLKVSITSEDVGEKIVEAISKSGFEAIEKEENSDDVDTHVTEGEGITKIAITLSLSILLMYIAMSHMMSLPIPEFISLHGNPTVFVLIQILLTIPIVYIGREFYKSGFKGMMNKKPNMDSLVAISTSVAVLYSIYISGTIIGLDNSSVDESIKMLLLDEYSHLLYFDTAAMIVGIIFLGRWLEDRAKQSTKGAIEKLLRLKPQVANVVVDGEIFEKQFDELVIGDIVRIKSGENVAIDGIIVEGSCSVDESLLTGESLPVDRFVGDQLVGGSTNINGLVDIEVNRVGKDTILNKIIKLISDAQFKKAPIARLADKVAEYFVPIVIAIATVSALVWMISGAGIGFSIKIFISVLVISCPCALGLATPTAIMVGIGRGAQLGVFVKDAVVLEAMGNLDRIIFDKTGTITMGKPTILNSNFVEETKKLEYLKYAAAIERNSTHPVAKAIVEYADAIILDKDVIDKVKITDYEDLIGFGVIAKSEDTVIHLGNEKLMQKHSIKITIPEDAMGTVVYMAIDNVYKGYFIIVDEIKSSSIAAISKMKNKDIKVNLLSGDTKRISDYVASKVGIDTEDVIADVLPQDKLEVVDGFISQGNFVGMVGDGINDAPALSGANVSFAMSSGSDIAIESADVIITSSDLKDVVVALELSGATIKNIKQNLFWAFFYNLLAIPFAAGVFYAFGGPLLNPMMGAVAMSLSSITVVLNALRLNSFASDSSKKNTI